MNFEDSQAIIKFSDEYNGFIKGDIYICLGGHHLITRGGGGVVLLKIIHTAKLYQKTSFS